MVTKQTEGEKRSRRATAEQKQQSGTKGGRGADRQKTANPGGAGASTSPAQRMLHRSSGASTLRR